MPKQSGLYARKILEAVIDFLCAAGTDTDEISRIVEGRIALNRKKHVRPKQRLLGRSDDTVTAAILHRWHRDTALIDLNAMPKPLKLKGVAPSVEALVRSERPRSDPSDLIASMVTLGLLKKASAGRYLPKARIATIPRMHPVLIEHVARSIARLLETVGENTTRKHASPLIERFTHIPDLPFNRIAEFREFSQRHGTAFLASVDDWLESRRVRNASRKVSGTTAGIHVFAYLEPPTKPTRRAKRA